MSYENAPATKMLATHCCACGRPLVDAKSVELGIGPDCRKKYGFDVDVPEANRRAANVIVYKVALNPQSLESLRFCEQLRLLGFEKLAAVVEKRVATVRIVVIDNEVRIVTPYNPEFVFSIRNIPGRRWHKDDKIWSVPLAQRAALWKAMNLHYSGKLAIGPKGPFVIAQSEAA